MFSPVIIKGNKQGIRLIIDSAAELYEVIESINQKLKNTGRYYSNIRPICVTLEGKKLTEDETRQLLDALRQTGLNITSPDCENKKAPIKSRKIPSEQAGLFFIGNLKCGQEIEAKASVVIIGDVEAGAAVTSTGNIIVLGKLDGYAKAGITGKTDAFVYADTKSIS